MTEPSFILIGTTFGGVVKSVFQSLLVVGITFIVLTLIASYLRYRSMTGRGAALGMEGDDLDDAFHLDVLSRIGTAHRNPAPFCVVLLRPSGWEEWGETHGDDVVEELLVYLKERVRQSTRKDDFLCRYQGDWVGLVVSCDPSHGRPFIQRLLGEVAREVVRLSSGDVLRLRCDVGAAGFPENGERAKELVSVAEEMISQAITAEGDAVRVAFREAAPAGSEAEADAKTEKQIQAQKKIIDELTGVLRYERLGSALQKYIARFRKDDRPVSVLYIDVDHLDRYNEHYSMQAGEFILKNVARLLEVGVREDDLIGRYGGDQFIVAMGGTSREAMVAAQRISADVKRESFKFGSGILRVTVTIGVAGYPDHMGVARQMVEYAEAAALASKRKEQGRCQLYDPAMGDATQNEKSVDTL